MENRLLEHCPNCSKAVGESAFFCGHCLTQVRCKSCSSILGKDDIGCINCGTPKTSQRETPLGSTTANTFRLHETKTDRTIEASFSDAVGKDLAGILRDSYVSRHGQGLTSISGISNPNPSKQIEAKYEDVHPASSEEDSTEDNLKNEGIPRNEEFPTLLVVAMKNLPALEKEWVLVYAFYASDFGQKIFTREDIIEKYRESNRFKETTRRDLTAPVKANVQSGHINILQNGFSILDEGIIAAKAILSRSSSSKPRSTNRSKKTAASKSSTQTDSAASASRSVRPKAIAPKRITGLNLVPDGKQSLSDFYLGYPVKNNFERSLLFVYYLTEMLKLSDVTPDHIYTCFDALDLPASPIFHQMLRDVKSKTGWIETSDSKHFRVTIKGQNQIKAWNKAQSK